MDNSLLTPQDVADILKIKKSTVYEMIKRGSLPAKKMGKQLRILPESIQQYLSMEQHTDAPVPDLYAKLNTDPYAVPSLPYFIISGQDELLDYLLNRLSFGLSDLRLLRSYQDSYNGLYAMYQEQVNAATCNLWDYKTDTYNLPFVQKLFPGEEIAMYRIAQRIQGFYVVKGNPHGIVSIHDLQNPTLRFINREKGSGARVLTDSLLQKHQIDPQKINGYFRSVVSALAAASIIAKGGADVAIGTESSLLHFDALAFIPLQKEAFDLVIRTADLNKEPISSLLKIMSDQNLREELSGLKGYDLTEMGQKIL